MADLALVSCYGFTLDTYICPFKIQFQTNASSNVRVEIQRRRKKYRYACSYSKCGWFVVGNALVPDHLYKNNFTATRTVLGAGSITGASQKFLCGMSLVGQDEVHKHP